MVDFGNVAIGAVFMLVGLATVYGGVALRRRARVIEETPTTSVASVRGGVVEVSGSALPLGASGRGRLSGKEAVLARYRIEERRSSGKRSKWVTLKEVTEPSAFVLDDGTGRVVVEVGESELGVDPDHKAASSWGKDPPPEAMALLKEHGIPHEGWFGANKTMRFTEESIQRGDTVFVLGHAFARATPAERKARFVIAQGGEDDPPMTVTTRSERDEVARLKRRAWGTWAFGGLFAAIGLAVLVAAFR